MKYSCSLLTVLCCLVSISGYCQLFNTYEIWEEIPGEISAMNYSEQQQLSEDGVIERVSKVTLPNVSVFLPDNTLGFKRPMVLICPGGGYSHLAIDKEGFKIAKWLNSIGVAAAVLKYRLPNDQIMEDKKIGPLQDAQQAMRFIRKQAADWNIDTQKVGVMGFSAGGHLAASLSTMYDKPTYTNALSNISARPDFSILIYPVISMEDTDTHKGSQENLLGKGASKSLKKTFSPNRLVNEKTPPAFLIHATDDKAVPVANSLAYYKALQRLEVSAELHIYTQGGHGFGLGNNQQTKQWTSACSTWLKASNIITHKNLYLFSYFKGNGEDGLHYAYSSDGFTWKALKGDTSFLTPTVGAHRLMRDPSIVKGGDGLYHMVWTCGWTEKGIGYASSPDLIHWSDQKYIPVMEHEQSARNSWAPEITYEPSSATYMIYWASTIEGRYPQTQSTKEKGYNHRMYYTTTKDFRTYTPTKILYEPGFNVIDASIVNNGDRFIMFLKDETREPVAKNIRIAYSEHMEGPYTQAGRPITGDYWAEGPTTARVGNSWIVYFDKYIDKQYGAVQSTDLKNWKDISSSICFPKGTRHGSVIEISYEDFLRDFSAYIEE